MGGKGRIGGDKWTGRIFSMTYVSKKLQVITTAAEGRVRESHLKGSFL